MSLKLNLKDIDMYSGSEDAYTCYLLPKPPLP